MEIELPTTVVLGIKIVSGLAATVVIFRLRKDIVKIWDWMRPRKKQHYSYCARPNMDAAWRQMIDDSRERKCEKSINLLNEWMAIRTHADLIRKVAKKKS
tara:strand:+ start:2614 stop:2913 length:300 start_codon:yes stop_codon:yes gene_type:complete